MNFEISEYQRKFQADVEEFLEANYSPEVMDENPEQFSQTVDSPPEGGPVNGRFERSYRYTVVDTIGGGACEIQ